MKTKWKLDPAHSEVSFKVKHMMITNLKGQFTSFQSGVESDGENFKDAKILFTIDVNSIQSNNPQRNTHLLSDDFFNEEKYPQIRFESSSMEKVSNNEWKLTGDLMIRDITNPISLKVVYGGRLTDPYGLNRVGFEVFGSVSRKAYNLRWNMLTETGGAIVSDEVKIECAVEYVEEK